jgi:hypothetical protein
MVVTLMGIGGVVVTGFTQGAKQETERERYLHNQRILEEAKQALLQYAYNYPVTAGNGPGRMPCPDTSNNGIPNATANCSGLGGVGILGRFPWAEPEMHFFDARDASGARLWYGVSNQFANSGGGVTVNSDTVGSITIQDRSGALLYDGSVNGIAAVIIAPGAPIDRNGVLQDRSVANADLPFDTIADTDPGIIDADNYLDLFGAVDNADFVNGTTDGFVTGPIDNRVSGVLQVNDQMIVISAAEVIAMAEKATLQAYRKAINDYLAATGGVYPWLYNYDGIEYDSGGGESVDVAIDKLSSYFPAFANFTDEDDYLGFDTSGNVDGIFGRIPSIFADYFTETDSQAVESRLSGSLSLIDPGTTDTYTLTETYCEDGCPQGTGGNKTFQHDLIHDGPTLGFETTQVLTDVGFVDIDPDVVGDDGRFTATFPVDESLTFEVYFWDEDNSPTGVWTACPGGADELIDCSRDGPGDPDPGTTGTPTPGVANGLKSRILHMTVKLDFSGVENFDFDYSNAPAITWDPASGTSHATISGTYDVADIISFPGVLSATYKFEQHWHIGDSQIILDPDDNSYATGDVDMTGFTLANVKLGIRYYPELPAWALSNDWHNSIRMVYALEYAPPGTGPCIVDTTCLQLEDSPGNPQDKISLLVIAGQHDWTDEALDDRLKNDVDTVFDAGNENDNPTFYRNRGNDKILVIEEL